MKTRIIGLLAAAVLTACSTSPAGQTGAGGSPSPSAEVTGPGADGAASPTGGDRAKKKPRRGDRPATPAPGDSAPGPGGDSQDGAGNGSSGASLVHPQAGRYLYDQDGYEEFCAGATCQREDLPPTQKVDATFRDRSPEAVTVVTDARFSERRSAKTTTVFMHEKVIVTNITVDFAYGAVAFRESIDPRPPIDAVIYPLRQGRSWSGSWEADTSGDYSFAVAAREPVAAAGRTIDTYRLDSEMVFRGEFRGTSEAQIWVDPDTGFIVKAAGVLDVTSDFGTYRSSFIQLLRSGPGYQ